MSELRAFYGSQTFISDTGVSLFDCYWFMDIARISTWEEENPYDNWDPKTDLLYTMIAHPENIRAILFKIWLSLGCSLNPEA